MNLTTEQADLVAWHVGTTPEPPERCQECGDVASVRFFGELYCGLDARCYLGTLPALAAARDRAVRC